MTNESSRQELTKTVEEISAWVSRDLSMKPRIAARFGSPENIEKLCREYLSSFATMFDPDLYSAFAKKCESELFPNLFSMIRTEESVPGTLDRIRSGKCPVIFLPNHDSNLDAMTHGIFFYVNRIPHPKITAGVNLCKKADGTTDSSVIAHLKGLNALVVDRKLLGRDLIYLKVFREYFIKTLEMGENHCFYIESGRSYGGGIKLGTTSAMLNWSLEARVDELLVVPIGVSYTRIFEDRDLVRCHQERIKMPETNLLEEFGRGARILGSDSPIYITTGRPVRFLRPGNGEARLTPDPESSVLLDHASREMRRLSKEGESADPSSWEHKLHDFAYLSMLTHRRILPHHVVARVLYTDGGDLISMKSISGNCSKLLDHLGRLGANIHERNTEKCVQEGISNLEKFGIVSPVSGGAVRIDSPGLCEFYGNKAVHPSMQATD